MIHINVSCRTPIARLNEDDFVIPHRVDMLAPSGFADDSEDASETEAHDDEDDQLVEDSFLFTTHTDPEWVSGANTQRIEYLIGRLWAERLDWFYAEECGFSVPSICDSRSGVWMQVLETISRNGGASFRKDLQLENFVSEVVFLHETLIHPEIQDRVALVAAAINAISSDNSLVLMFHEQSADHHLEDWECHALGFKKIARSNLLLRDNHFRFPFGESYTAGRAVDFEGTAEHESWIREHWHALLADHPSL